MREFKFRAWNKEDKYMVTTNASVSSIVASEIYGGNRSYKIMQYTGLKDNNGKEIYEGDIVTSTNGQIQGIVIFQAPSFIIKRTLKCIRWSEFVVSAKENQFQTVVGNIYENSDLLK